MDMDPILPMDEKNRELSLSLPFGSQSENVFDEAEYYKVINDEYPDLVPLDLNALACDQGVHRDASFDCRRIPISNKVCGHEGTISLSSPEYQVYEHEGHIRLTIRRTGGGVGEVSVSYGIEDGDGMAHGLERDVSETAMYTTEVTVTFYNHEIERSFLLPIHNDIIKVR